jgi:type VI secretion system protein ImpM
MTKPNSPYGWYGKVPYVGDFVRSGLSPQFVEAWDNWVQAELLPQCAHLALCPVSRYLWSPRRSGDPDAER